MENLTFDERDEFQRKTIAEKAIKLLNSDIDISPLVIDGGWGTGKTEFCYKFINLMKTEESHHLIYVDAFKADHTDEPLFTVLAEVIKILPEDEEREGLIKKAIPAIRYSLKTLAKAGVSHLLRQDATNVVNNFDKEIQKAADKAIDASVKSLLKDHLEANESLETLQTALKTIAAQKPIIIFIDELDRCRPNFAISMLEIIKHTFNVDGLQFVLITNKQQLKASINHCYGDNVESQRYLDKFLKFTISLPNEFVKQGYNKTQASVTHFRNSISQNSNLKKTNLNKGNYDEFIQHIIKIQNLSLREIETFVRHLEVYQVLNNNNAFPTDSESKLGIILLQILSIAIFCFNPDLAASILDNSTDAKVLAKFLGEDNVKNIKNKQNEINSFKHHQVVLMMLTPECHTNKELFILESEHDKDSLKDIFMYRYSGSYSSGEMMKVLMNTFNYLNLGN